MTKFDASTVRHIVVVENEPLMRDLLAKAIESAGFRVTTAANAADAKRAMVSVDPDAFVLDIELGPGPNGFDFAEIVMKDSPTAGIVFLTHLHDPRFGGKSQSVVKKTRPICANLRSTAVKSLYLL